MKKEYIVVLLYTYNGEQYLEEQLNSVLSQKIENCKMLIIVRDDGSTDNTRQILHQYMKNFPDVFKIYYGENIGWKNSFIELLFLAPKAEYYAFCDQDDIWDCDKLLCAIEKLKRQKQPALYCCAARMIDNDLKNVGIFKIPSKFDLENTLIQCRVLGCTQVFNYQLYKHLIKIEKGCNIAHDWWTMCVALLKGTVISDLDTHISYRQQGRNVFGGKQNIFKRISRILSSDVHKREKVVQQLIRVFPECENVFLNLVRKYRSDIKSWIKLFFYRFTDVSIKRKLFFKIYLLMRKI